MSEKHKTTFLSEVGDGTGNLSMNVNGSLTPVEFKCTPQEGYKYLVHRMVVSVEDAGTIDSGAYGNGIVLTNGIELKIVRANGDIEYVIDENKTIKTNSCWASYCHDVNVLSFGSGNSLLVVRWTFTKDGVPIVLNRHDSLVMTVKDDLTTLVSQHVKLGIEAVK